MPPCLAITQLSVYLTELSVPDGGLAWRGSSHMCDQPWRWYMGLTRKGAMGENVFPISLYLGTNDRESFDRGKSSVVNRIYFRLFPSGIYNISLIQTLFHHPSILVFHHPRSIFFYFLPCVCLNTSQGGATGGAVGSRNQKGWWFESTLWQILSIHTLCLSSSVFFLSLGVGWIFEFIFVFSSACTTVIMLRGNVITPTPNNGIGLIKPPRIITSAGHGPEFPVTIYPGYPLWNN